MTMVKCSMKIIPQERISMRDYVDMRFTNIERATDLASNAVDKRLEGMNEFREQLNKQAALFVTRSELEDKLKAESILNRALEARISLLENTISNLQGRFWAIGVGFTIFSTIIGIALHFLH